MVLTLRAAAALIWLTHGPFGLPVWSHVARFVPQKHEVGSPPMMHVPTGGPPARAPASSDWQSTSPEAGLSHEESETVSEMTIDPRVAQWNVVFAACASSMVPALAIQEYVSASLSRSDAAAVRAIVSPTRAW